MRKWLVMFVLLMAFAITAVPTMAQDGAVCTQDVPGGPVTCGSAEAVSNYTQMSMRATGNMVEDYAIVETEHVGNLTLQWTNHAMKDRGDGTTFYDWAQATYPDWHSIVASDWATPPNVPNPLVSWFPVRNGTEVPNGVAVPDSGEDNFCQVLEGEWCTNVMAVGHYTEYTGAGWIPNLWDGLNSEPGVGHVFSYWNVGETDARLDGIFKQGWRQAGPYFNGDALSDSIAAVHGHAANNMLDLVSALNPEPLTNFGSNCSNRDGCDTIEHTAVIGSGNAPLLIITAVSVRTTS